MSDVSALFLQTVIFDLIQSRAVFLFVKMNHRPGMASALRFVHSKWTFLVLQGLDLVTTLAAFEVGAFEVNPLVARLTHEFGAVGGLIGSKLMALLIILRVRRLVWLANVFYSAVVLWNIYVLVTLAIRSR